MGMGLKGWNTTARDFTPCDICGVGLGEFEWHDTRYGRDRWIKVEGETLFKWTEGELTVTYQEFDDNDDLVWVKDTFTPKIVCPECYLKHSKES